MINNLQFMYKHFTNKTDQIFLSVNRLVNFQNDFLREDFNAKGLLSFKRARIQYVSGQEHNILGKCLSKLH